MGAAAAPQPTRWMRAEILEQPEGVARLASQLSHVREICETARRYQPRFVLYVARGTSDNAAVYGKYLTTIRAGLPAGLAAPSTATLYGARVDLRHCWTIGISQSGATADVAEFLAQAREQGSLTLAITNDPSSRLATTADMLLDTQAGPERAVPATKTYTSQLAALAMLWSVWTSDVESVEALGGAVPQAMRTALAEEAVAAELARSALVGDRLLVTGRGYNYATSLETALKLTETSYVSAMAFSAADLLHGPLAMVEPTLPSLVFAIPGPTYPSVVALLRELRSRRGPVIVIGPAGEALSMSETALRLPGGLPEHLSPLLAIVPAQLMAYHLALHRGIEPDHPRGLSKVSGAG
ncbi:MAG TPA: SIS domain-containing protein [Candidatus Limnocylindrales bacterium]|nr:SIS domain-containing protein [Candidatus Limnocylindrales bacterium]